MKENTFYAIAGVASLLASCVIMGVVLRFLWAAGTYLLHHCP